MGLQRSLGIALKPSWRAIGSISANRVVRIYFVRYEQTSTGRRRPLRSRQHALSKDSDSTHEPNESSSERHLPRARDKIYIAGWAGAVGRLIAHSLISMPSRPPVVLLHHRSALAQQWAEAGEVITLRKHGINDSQRGFESQMATRGFQMQNPDAEPIYNLILTSKAYMAAVALKALAWRLRPESTVVFLQNGMGLLDEVNRDIFPDPSTRPHYMSGIVTHGVQAAPDFLVKHHGSGSIALTTLPRQSSELGNERRPNSDEFLPASARYLLRNLTGAPALCALGIYPTDFLQLQLEKLAANAVINPFTALFGCQNGEFLNNEAMVRLMRLLLAEISLVICSLPELESVSKVRQRFSSRSLELYVINIAKQTAENRSSMLTDMDNGKLTEIDYINGFFVHRGEELGIRCITNYTVLQMVKAKTQLARKAMQSMVPLEERAADLEHFNTSRDTSDSGQDEDKP